MDKTRRAELARRALAGYVSGTTATTEATARALTRIPGSRAVVLVEGISDQIALETLAVQTGRDLDGEGVVVLPVGGVHGISTYLERFGPHGANLTMAGLCDANEAAQCRQALAGAGVGTPETRLDMAALGFHVCDEDLEDELLRAAGPVVVEALFESQGDLSSFRTLQRQPAWRGQRIEAQMRRYLGSGARRKLRYARLLVETIPDSRMPHPIAAALAAV